MSDSDNPYQAPDAELVSGELERGGSIENTLAGNAHLDFSEVLSEAWQKSSEVRAPVLIAGVVMVIIAAFIQGIGGVLFGFEDQSFAAAQLVQLFVTIAIYPLLAGIFMIGLRASVGLPSELANAFDYYGMLVGIVAVGILQSIATTIGMVLLILPGLYLAFALSLAIPLKVDKNLGVIESLTTSLQIVNKKFLTVAGLAIVGALIMSLGFVTIIGWIWTAPWILMVYAITYRQLAGASLEA